MNNNTMQKVNLSFDIAWTVGVLLASVGFLAILGYQYTAGNITNLTFFIAYVVLGLISVVFAGLSVFYHIFDRSHDTFAEKGLASTFFISDTTKLRFLSNPLLKLLTFGVITVIITLAVFGIGSVTPIYNPYGSEALSKSILEQHDLAVNIFNISVYPGFYEEFPIFTLISIIVFIITFGVSFLFAKGERRKEVRNNPALFLIALIIAVSFGATLFTVAHNTAYGLDTQAKVSAFVFEWIVQFANQITGTFASFIPHALHNALVVFGTQTSFTIGGTATAIVLFYNETMFRILRLALNDFTTVFRAGWQQLVNA